jgi:hypothetical protein
MRRSWGEKAALLLAALCLVSCSSAVDLMRDATGASKNDPAPDARNTKNLEAGSEKPYPNLGTVPPPPVRALSTAEREALQKSLAADRANAKYIDEQLRAGQTASAPRPAPPPPAEETAEAAATPAKPSPAAPTEEPQAALATPPAAAAPPPAAASAPSAAAAPAPPEPPPAAAPRPPVQVQELPNEAPATPPQVRSVPQPETPPAAPPPPTIAGPGAPPPAPPPSAPKPAQAPVAAAPAPAPKAPTPQIAALAPGQPAADIAFARDSAALPAPGRSRLEQIAATQRERGGTVRVVTEAAPAGGTSGALAAFGLALDRANAVALALAEAGVPQRSIQVETAPPGTAPGRTRVYLQN